MRVLILLFGFLINFNIMANTQDTEGQSKNKHYTTPGLVQAPKVSTIIPQPLSEEQKKAMAPAVDHINMGGDVDAMAGAMPWSSPTEKAASGAIKPAPRESREKRALIFLIVCVGLALAIFIYRKSNSAYGKSKEIYSNIKEAAEQKRVARLVEDEALKVQVRKEMQSAPATTESILKEQISEALNRGDSKLATELLELFKLSQENNK